QGAQGRSPGDKKSRRHSWRAPQISISSKAMSIMNSFVNHVFERLAGEGAGLTAMHLRLLGDPAKRAMSKGTKAAAKYASSK
ncbi:hypothetical protein FD755_021951, partial [Muntiacus reevesi]